MCDACNVVIKKNLSTCITEKKRINRNALAQNVVNDEDDEDDSYDYYRCYDDFCENGAKYICVIWNEC